MEKFKRCQCTQFESNDASEDPPRDHEKLLHYVSHKCSCIWFVSSGGSRGGIGGIYPPKHTFRPAIRMNVLIIISLLGTTIPNFNVLFVATIPNSKWWPGASSLDPTGGLTAPPRPPPGLMSLTRDSWIRHCLLPLPNIAGYATVSVVHNIQEDSIYLRTR